tara:strand:- start:5752 stop:6015 length:264 start_codon:yes stop_codon:yes gene_type:complete
MKDINITNPTLKEVVQKETEIKTWLVNYVGNKVDPEDGNVTVEMLVEQISEEFPEFVMVLAEENFMRGYEQALTDVESINSETQSDV